MVEYIETRLQFQGESGHHYLEAMHERVLPFFICRVPVWTFVYDSIHGR